MCFFDGQVCGNADVDQCAADAFTYGYVYDNGVRVEGLVRETEARPGFGRGRSA